jgi:actin-related protein
MNAPENREQTAEIMFEGLNIQGTFRQSVVENLSMQLMTPNTPQDSTLPFRPSLRLLPVGPVTK